MKKLTFDEVMELINDQRPVDVNQVQSRALSRHVWVAEWHIPGCLSESSSVGYTKAGAIDTACMYAETDEGIPRGMKTALRKHGRFDGHSDIYGNVITTVDRVRLSSIL